MGFFAWLLRRDEPVAETLPEEDDAEMRENLRREEWMQVYAQVYAAGLTGASVAGHLQRLKEFAAQAADAAMELANERFPLTTLDEAPQVMQAPSQVLHRVARSVQPKAGATPAAPSAETIKADVPAAAPGLETGLQHGLT